MAPTILFVYGSLKRGFPANHLLEGQELIGPAQTLPRYRLYDCGDFPGMVFDPENGIAVEGELWRVDEATLRRLDDFENVPTLFTRQPIAVSGLAAPASAYFFNGNVSVGADCGSVWPIESP